MAMFFEELDEVTRGFMLAAFDEEDSSPAPYRSKALSTEGLTVFPAMSRAAIQSGTEETLRTSLTVSTYWNPTENYVRNGKVLERRINFGQAAERLALTEFNTWYVCGLGRRLRNEGVENCEVYRGAQPKWEPAGCTDHEGATVQVQLVLDGHRRRYWPEPGDSSTFSIPFAPGCHHTIRRTAQDRVPGSVEPHRMHVGMSK